MGNVIGQGVVDHVRGAPNRPFQPVTTIPGVAYKRQLPARGRTGLAWPTRGTAP